MTERDLTTVLREHLRDEPPIAITSHDAIRAGRRPTRLRAAAAAGAVVAALGGAALVVPQLGGDGGAPGRATDAAPSTQRGASLPETLEAVAAARLTPLLGELGTPTWDVTDVDLAPVEPQAEDAQYFQLSYHPAGGSEVHLRVGGFATADDALFLAPACPVAEQEDTVASCTDETLPSGTVVTVAVGPHARVTNTGSRSKTVQWALRHPDDVLWARSVTVATPDGVTTSASEYVEATAPETAGWQVPEDVLRGIASDTDLLDPDGVAHAPLG